MYHIQPLSLRTEYDLCRHVTPRYNPRILGSITVYAFLIDGISSSHMYTSSSFRTRTLGYTRVVRASCYRLYEGENNPYTQNKHTFTAFSSPARFRTHFNMTCIELNLHTCMHIPSSWAKDWKQCEKMSFGIRQPQIFPTLVSRN